MAEENVVFVGKKPTMNYVLAVVTQFNTGADNVAPFTPEGVAPFGGTEYMVEENETFAVDEPPAAETPSPFGVNMFEAESAWGDDAVSAPPPTGESAFAASAGPALDTVADEVFEGGTPFVEDAGPTVGGGDVFTGADVFETPDDAATADESDFDFESAPAALRAAMRGKGTTGAAATDYFAQIPADIEPLPAMTRRGVLLLVAIVVMIALNGVSFALLF